jgi:hypothetical protein
MERYFDSEAYCDGVGTPSNKHGQEKKKRGLRCANIRLAERRSQGQGNYIVDNIVGPAGQ